MNIGLKLVTLFTFAVGALPMTANSQANIRFASDAVRRAAEAPEVAAVLEVAKVVSDATISQDVGAFEAAQAPELVVNSPADRILTGPQAVGAFKAGLIDYSSSERVIEYAALRPNGEVLLMGSEHITPRGHTRNAGKSESYRVTELWRKVDRNWKLSVRQATITDVH